MVTQAGSGGTPYILTRAQDMDQSTEFGGALVAVKNLGTDNDNTIWFSSNAESVTVGTTAVTFVSLNSPVSLTGADPIEVSGGVVSLTLDPGASLVSGPSGLYVDFTKGTYAQNIGNGSATSIVVTHNLGTQDVKVSLRQVASPYATVS